VYGAAPCTAATTKSTTAVTSSTASVGDRCSGQCARCVVRSRDGRVRCLARRRGSRMSSSHRRAPGAACRPGFVPGKHRRRCRGALSPQMRIQIPVINGCRKASKQELNAINLLSTMLLSTIKSKSQIPLRCLAADRFKAGRRPAASWNLAYHLAR